MLDIRTSASSLRAACALLGFVVVASPAAAEFERNEWCWRDGPPSSYGRQAPYWCEMDLAWTEMDMRRWSVWLRRGAEAGHSWMQWRLAIELRGGRYMPKDEARAAYWALKAAQAEYAPAQALVGSWYYLGRALPRDHALARLWNRRAADDGDMEAMFVVSTYYRHGVGGVVDKPLAAYYLGVARSTYRRDAKGRLTDDERLFRIGVWHLCTTVAPRDVDLARRFLKEAAARKHAAARRLLDRDLEKAATWAQCLKWPDLTKYWK